MSPVASGIMFAMVLVMCGAIYLLPTIIAHCRNHRQEGPICVINMLLGWTFLAWVGCLAWSLSSDVKEQCRRKPPII